MEPYWMEEGAEGLFGWQSFQGPWGLWMPMTYPRSRREERDLEYWKSLYPQEVKELQNRIEELGEELDYRGSFLYDEYPDRLALGQLTERIRLEAKDPEAQWLKMLIPVLLYQEMHRRRRAGGRFGRGF